MAKSDNQKLKILYILDYLQKNSHEGHPVRASELIAMLDRNYRIQCERKTIYSDIAALQEYGADIVALPGKNGGYYISSCYVYNLVEQLRSVFVVFSELSYSCFRIIQAKTYGYAFRRFPVLLRRAYDFRYPFNYRVCEFF